MEIGIQLTEKKQSDMMGNVNQPTKNYQSDSTDVDRDLECGAENGLILCGQYFPEEVLGHILAFVDEKSLVSSCRLVCRIWRDVVQKQALRSRAEMRKCINLRGKPQLLLKLNWKDFYWLIHRSPNGRNLLANNCGQNGLKNWIIERNGGDGWIVESTPHGTEGLPPVNAKLEPHPDFMGLSSCFATSFYPCLKEQLINLDKHGLTNNVMDYLQPPILISEWTACRFDCGSVYELHVSLLDENMSVVEEFKAKEDFLDFPREVWRQIMHVFQDYPPGVRYIRFFHSGVDTQFWKGHYGSKMSGGSVKVYTNLKENVLMS